MVKSKYQPNEEEKVLNKCPLCGGRLEYNSLMQYAYVFNITKSGKLSKKRRREDYGPMECGFINCTSEDCDFHTNCDLDCEENLAIHVFQDGDIYKYTFNDSL